MPNFDIPWPVLIPLAVIGFFAWRYFKSGSIVGALLGGRIKDTVGEIPLTSVGPGSRTLRVYTLESNGGGAPDVALAITSKAPLSASVVPFKLSHTEAQQLIGLLQKASQG